MLLKKVFWSFAIVCPFIYFGCLLFYNHDKLRAGIHMFYERSTSELLDIQLTTIPTLPYVSSAYEYLGFKDLKMMQPMPEFRGIFNFTLIPNVDFVKEYMEDPDYRWSMVVIVKSHSDRKAERDKIRKTWGSKLFHNGVQLVTLFLTGLCQTPDKEIDLLMESREHGDIMQLDMKESYEKIGMKSLAGMQWAYQNLPSHWIYSSADDDMVPNHDKLYSAINQMKDLEMQRLNSLGANYQSVTEPTLLESLPIHCGFSCRVEAGPIRGKESKWFIDSETYPLQYYPSLCLGGFYSMPVSLAGKIFSVSREHVYFHLDDVWITGLLRLSYYSLPTASCLGCNQSDPNIGIWTQRINQGELVRHYGKG